MTLLPEGFSHFVTSMTAPVASGWSGWPGGISHPLENAAFARRTPEAEAFLVREYRLAVRNPSGFVVEVPGGSSREPGLTPRAIALEELAEELGLAVAPSRLVALGSRQCAPTLASHHTHLFALALTAAEAARLRGLAEEGRVLGADSEERIRLVRQPLAGPFDASLDWASLGMLAAAAAALAPHPAAGETR